MKIRLIQHQSYKIGIDSYHFRSIVITTDTSHIRIVVPWVDNNRSTNKCIVTNRGIRNIITDFEHNKESTFDSIWNTRGIDRSNYNTNGLDYSIARSVSNFWPTRLGNTSNLTFLIYFDSKFRNIIQNTCGEMLKE